MVTIHKLKKSLVFIMALVVAFLYVMPAYAAQEDTALPGFQQDMQRIQIITETSFFRQNVVIITIITRADTNAVWVQFDENRFTSRGRIIEQNNQQRTWRVNYTPVQFEPHIIQVYANHAFTETDAEIYPFHVTSAIFPVSLNINQFIRNDGLVFTLTNGVLDVRTYGSILSRRYMQPLSRSIIDRNLWLSFGAVGLDDDLYEWFRGKGSMPEYKEIIYDEPDEIDEQNDELDDEINDEQDDGQNDEQDDE
jgi:hypothetical protein